MVVWDIHKKLYTTLLDCDLNDTRGVTETAQTIVNYVLLVSKSFKASLIAFRKTGFIFKDIIATVGECLTENRNVIENNKIKINKKEVYFNLIKIIGQKLTLRCRYYY